jgi:hypothetical protein
VVIFVYSFLVFRDRGSYYKVSDVQPSLLLTTAVNKLLHKNNFPATLSIEQCAPLLAMSIASFRRKLAKEETSFKHIQSKFLNELCVEALITKRSKIENLATQKGLPSSVLFAKNLV